MSLKILFMGTPEFAVPVLKSVFESNHELLAVYTRPPKKKFRGQKIINSPIHKCADDLKIPVKCPENINSKEIEYIKKLNPNVVIVVAYGLMIPENILNLSNILFINIHASLLPKWRGAAPIQRAILNQDKETGISIMKIEKELDSGPVMKTIKVKIDKETTYDSLSKKMSGLAASLIIECLEILSKKNERFIPQDNSKATYAKKIDKSEAQIRWKDKARDIIAKINAFYPNPGAWFELKGSRIKILKAIEVEKSGNPGEIIDNDFTIACSQNSVQILELKKEGKRSMSANDFLKGNQQKIGSIINGS